MSPRISLPVANLGEIPGKIAPRFLPPWICFSARTLARFPVGFRPDFGRRDYCFLARIMVRFAAGSCRDFGCRDFCFSARILARFTAGSRREFGRREFRFPARFPPERKIPAAKISPGSRQDPAPYFTRVRYKERSVSCLACLQINFMTWSWSSVLVDWSMPLNLVPRFWLPGFLLLSENLGEIHGRIPARIWPPGISLPGEIPAGKKNPGRQNFAGIPPRSRSLFY